MQHHPVSRPAFVKPVAIEVDGEPLGVVVPATEGFRFLAVRFNAFDIDGQFFTSPEAARAALSASVHSRSR